MTYPFAVATLLWERRPGELCLTICAKATLSLTPQTATLAPPLDGVHEDVPWGGGGAASLYSPSDYVPFKPRVDVMLVGRTPAVPGLSAAGGAAAGGRGPDAARAPGGGLFVGLRVDGLSKRLQVTGDLASAGFGPVPLAVRAARAAAAGGRSPDAAGAQAQAEALLWAQRVRHRPGPPPPGFDFGLFNAAPLDQQMESLEAAPRIGLENLIAHAPNFETRLPPMAPRAMCVDPVSGRSMAVALRCDALWIDADRAMVVVSWRGTLTVADERNIGAIQIVDEPAPAKKASVAFASRTVDASAASGGAPLPFVPGAAPPAAPEGPVPSSGAKRASGAASFATGTRDLSAFLASSPTPFQPIKGDEETSPAKPSPLNALPPFVVVAQKVADTVTPPVAASSPSPVAAPPLPVSPSPSPVAAPPPVADTAPPAVPEKKTRASALSFASGTTDVDAAMSRTPLPFQPGAPIEAVPQAVSESAQARRARVAFATGTVALPESLTAEPFPVAPPPAPAPEPPPFAPLPLAPLPVAPPPFAPPMLSVSVPVPGPALSGAEPAPAVPKPLPIDAYAALTVALREGRMSRAEALSRHGVDEATWAVTERHYKEALESEAKAGRCELALDLGKAMRAARRAKP